MKKEKWIKPKLVVLTRGRPEEMLLASCKDKNELSGPNGTASLPCDEAQYCGNCNAITAS